MFSAIVPILALLLGAVGLLSESHSIWLALAAGLTILSVEGIRYARATQMGFFGAAAILIANVLLGVCVVALKVELVH